MYYFIHSSVEVHVWVGAVQIELSMSRIRLHIFIIHALSGSGWAFVGACAFLGMMNGWCGGFMKVACMGRNGMDSVEEGGGGLQCMYYDPNCFFRLFFQITNNEARVSLE